MSQWMNQKYKLRMNKEEVCVKYIIFEKNSHKKIILNPFKYIFLAK